MVTSNQTNVNMRRITSHILNLLCALPLCWLAACAETDDLPEGKDGHLLQLMVSTGTMGGDSGSGTSEEQAIHSIYVYAYDDKYPTNLPDFYENKKVEQTAASGTYAFPMNVYDAGTKRFYVFVNPPEYIRQELVYNADEAKLKSLSIYQNKPLKNIADLQQTIDGKAGGRGNRYNGPVGLPMSNAFEVQVDFEEGNPRQLWLYPMKRDGNNKIQGSIPLFRALGKMTIQARMKDGVNVPKASVTIKRLKIFNYTANGSGLPVWQLSKEDCYWQKNDKNRWNWNSGLKMDLEQLVLKENAIMDQTVDLLDKAVVVDEQLTTLTTFYLCQNSYGPDAQLAQGEWNGLPDPVGNRITKLSVELQDGRKTEVPLPFLCRNDHLTVTLTITLHGITVEFEKWKEVVVHPDWNDEVVDKKPLPKPEPPTP